MATHSANPMKLHDRWITWLILLALCGCIEACSDDNEGDRATPTLAPTVTRTVAPSTPTVVPTPAAPTPIGGFAEAGRVAFYDTLVGTQDRNEEAVDLLNGAVRVNAEDGPSWFRLGMMHLWRLARVWNDIDNPSDFVKQEVVLAREALGKAVPLVPEDTRIPGFHAAARFNEGVIFKDEMVRIHGLHLLRESMKLNFLFNSFDFMASVAPIVGPDDPLFAEAIGYLEQGLTMLDACTPQICGNEGYARHNLQGTFLLFGDMYAKYGDADRAREFYSFTQGQAAGWAFKSIVDERVMNVDARVALYADSDPNNDPKLVGFGPEACAFCHY